MSSDAKVIGFPGDTSIGPGATLTWTMEAPCDFVGRRLVLQAIDTASGADRIVMVRSARHDNIEFVANGRTSLVPTVNFPPPVWRGVNPAGDIISVAGVDSPNEFHECFATGDLWQVTIFNQTGQNLQMLMYWMTDYGESCGCKKGR